MPLTPLSTYYIKHQRPSVLLQSTTVVDWQEQAQVLLRCALSYLIRFVTDDSNGERARVLFAWSSSWWARSALKSSPVVPSLYREVKIFPIGYDNNFPPPQVISRLLYTFKENTWIYINMHSVNRPAFQHFSVVLSKALIHNLILFYKCYVSDL